MNIAIASGKGGTGKTTIAVSLAYFLATSGQSVQYIDCDVEEPNGHLFLKPKIESRKTAYVMVPKIIEEKCTFCGECSSKCQYNALVSLPDIPPLYSLDCAMGAVFVFIYVLKMLSLRQKEK